MFERLGKEWEAQRVGGDGKAMYVRTDSLYKILGTQDDEMI